MEILILGVLLIPFLTSLLLKVAGKSMNELLTNFVTLYASLLSVAISFFLFGDIFLDKFKPLKFELFEWFPDPQIVFEFYLDGLIWSDDGFNLYFKSCNSTFFDLIYEQR